MMSRLSKPWSRPGTSNRLFSRSRVFVPGARPGAPGTKLCSEYIFDCSNVQVEYVELICDTLEHVFVLRRVFDTVSIVESEGHSPLMTVNSKPPTVRRRPSNERERDNVASERGGTRRRKSLSEKQLG